MHTSEAAQRLSAIGHPNRLNLFRHLIKVGPAGVAAGELARVLDLAPSSLNFHLRALQQCGLIESTTQGRFVIYSACFEVMADLLTYLTDDCCGGNPCFPTSGSHLSQQCTSNPHMESES
jgi:ArsR family transcriptional regulator, arsenate/arsenite/antimonite-responsive transcriptional repressor